MPKYTNTLTDNQWLKIIANESAEINRLLRILLGKDSHSTNVTDTDNA